MSTVKTAKGLDALKNAASKLKQSNLAGEKISILSIEDVQEDPDNPRQTYDEGRIKELALSIAANGQLQPISVRDNPDEKGKYFSNFGSSRVRAIRWLKENMPENPHSSHIKAIVNNTFGSMGKLVENIQRENLSAFDIGLRLKKEVDEKGLSQKEICEQLGKDKPWVSRHLKVAEVSEHVKNLIKEGIVSNVEVILNVEKMYKENSTKLEELLNKFREESEGDTAVTLAQSRKWLKSFNEDEAQESEPVTVEKTTVTETQDEKELSVVKVTSTDNNVEEVVQSNESLDTKDDEFKLKVSEPSDVSVEELKRLQVEAEQLIKSKQDESAKKPKHKENISSELKEAYVHGALMGYQHLFELATENEDESEASLSKMVLKSFAGQNVVLDWAEIGNYYELCEEVAQILASFQSAGYVSPSALKNAELDNLIKQEDLI